MCSLSSPESKGGGPSNRSAGVCRHAAASLCDCRHGESPWPFPPLLTLSLLGRPVFSPCSLFGTAVFMSGESVSSGKEPWGATGWETCLRLLVSKAEALPPLVPASRHVDEDVSHHPEVSEGIPGRADHDHDLPSQTQSLQIMISLILPFPVDVCGCFTPHEYLLHVRAGGEGRTPSPH